MSTALSSEDEMNSSLESSSVNDSNNDLMCREDETKALNEEIDTLKAEIETLKVKIEALEEENKELEASRNVPIQSPTEELDDLKESVEALMKEKTDLSDKNNCIESELEKLREELKLERQSTFKRYALQMLSLFLCKIIFKRIHISCPVKQRGFRCI